MTASSVLATAPPLRAAGPAPKVVDWVEPFTRNVDSNRARGKAFESVASEPHTFYGEAPLEQPGGTQQVTLPFFGPKRYTRTAGPPNVFDETIAVPAWLVGPYTLHVQNGEPNGTHRLSSATVDVNGVTVARQNDFNQNVAGFDRTVTLTAVTALRVRLTSNPGGYLTINLAGANADRTSPQAAIVTPVPGSSSTNVSPRVTVSYRDPAGAGEPGASAANPATLRVTLDGVDRTGLFTKGADQASADLAGAVQLAEGLHTLAMTIQDHAGNAATANAQFRVDLTAPSIGPIEPASGNYAGTRRPPITIHYQDGAELDLQTLRVFINDVDRTALFTRGATQASATLDDANQLPEGANTIVARVRDTAGNEASATSAFIVDVTNPVVAIAQPEHQSFTDAETVDVTGTITDSSPTTVTINGVPAVVTGSMFKLAGVSLGATRTATFTAVATDAAGNTGERAVTVTIDRVDPVVTIAAPSAGGYFRSGTLVVEGTLVDESATDVSVNGVTATVTGNTFTATLETTDGRLDLHVIARDKANNIGEATSYVVIDSAAPALEITAPADGLITNAASIAVNGRASDSSPFSLTVDGTAVNVAGGTFASTVSLTSDGPRSVEVVATDAAGNRATKTVTVTADKTLPSIQIVNPQRGAFLAAADTAVSIQWSDSRGIDAATMQVLVDGEDRTSLFMTSSTGATGTLAGLGEGLHSIVARIADRGANRAEAETMFIVDTAGPAVAIEQPTDNVFTAAATVDVHGTVSDASDVTVRVNGVVASVANGSFTANGIPVGDPPAATITAVATDAAGNTRQASIRVNVDRAPPAIQITSPGAGAYLQGPTVSVTGTVSDVSPHSVEVNGQTAVVTNGTFTAQVPATDGSLTIQATATDAASNSTSAQVTVTIDTKAPDIAVTSPADGTITNLSSIAISAAVTDTAPVTVRVNSAPVELSNGAFSTVVALPGEGPRAIVITAVDAAGNTSTRQLAITRDATPPELTIVTPAENATLGAQPISVTGLVQDLTPVVVRVNGVDASRAQNSWTGSAGFASEGTQTITVTAIDAAGNQSTVARNVLLDLLAPVVTIEAPAPDALTAADTITVAGRVSDAGPVGLTVGGVATPVQGGTFSAVVPLTEGENHIQVIATDGLARPGGAEVVVTRDSTPPIVEMSAPESISRRRGAQATITASDSFSLDRVVVMANGVTLGSYTQAQTVVDLAVPEALAAGSLLVVTATAIDRAGNATTATRSLRVIADGVIVGQALADDTGLPLPGATIRMKDRTLTTDERGAYAIPASDVSVLITVASDGMTGVERLVPVEAGVGTAVVDARLTPLGAAVTVDGTVTALTSPAVPRIANAVRVSLLAGAVPAGSTMRLTQLSPQGLPGLLPLGWSPLAAFDIRSSAGASGLRADVRFATLVPSVAGAAGAPPDTVHLVQYRSSLHAWVMAAPHVPVTNGEAIVDLPMLIGSVEAGNTFAFVAPDAVEPPIPIAPIGEPLTGVGMTVLPPAATSAGAVTPAIMPPGGGTALGLLAIQSPAPLPSGTIVQTQVTETFTLASGEVASEETRRQDIVLYRVPSIAPSSVSSSLETFTAALSALFPITPTRTFAPAQLVQGRVHLDVLAGREAVRGQSGGSEPLTLTSDAVTFTVPARALTDDTAIGIQTAVLSAFLPAPGDLTPLVEVTIDLSGATLLIGAELAVATGSLGPVGPSDRFLVARVERLDGVPRLSIVAVADNLGDRLVSRAVFGLPGIDAGGRYVFYKTTAPFGFAVTTVTAGGTPVAAALLSSDRWPFFARTNAAGAATLAAPEGLAQVTARVPGTALEGSAAVTLAPDQMTSASIALNGTVTVATVTPADGAGAVPPSIQIEVMTTGPIAASSVTAAVVRLTTGGSEVAVRRVLAGSARTLAIVPQQRLLPGAEYHLVVSGLVDIHGGPIAVPPVTFRTLTESVLVFDPEQLKISFPDANGVVTLTAAAHSLPPGTSVLVVNAGSGEVASFTVGNDGSLAASLSATIDHRLIVTITTPTGETSTFERTKYVAADGTTAIGAAGGVIEGAGGIEIRIPDGATDKAVVMKIEPFDADFMPDRPTMPGAHFGSGIKIGSTSETHFKKEVDLAFPLPAGVPANPSDAYYYIYRRIEGPNGEVLFETVDNAFVEGAGEKARVVTASFPFTGYKDGWNQWQPVGPGMAAMGFGMVGTMATCHAIVMWTHNALLPGRPTLGVVVGKVMRARFVEGAAAPVFEGVPGVLVRRDDSAASGNNNIAITQADGQFVFYDPLFETGQQRIRAESAQGTFYATTFAVSELDSKIVTDDALTALVARGHFQNIAYANITLPPLTPPAPAPQVAIKVFTETGGVRKDTKGIVIEGTPVIIGFTAKNGTVSGATINGVEYGVRVDPLQGQPAAGGMDAILDAPFVPAKAGSFTVTGTAQAAFGPPASSSLTFRVIAAGGGTTTSVPGRPGVLSVVPKAGASGVPVSTFVQLAFSEPVTHITAENVTLIGPDGAVTVRMSGVAIGADGSPIPVDTVTSTHSVTSLTLVPEVGLRYDATYQIRLTDAIVDRDLTANGEPNPQPLVPFTSSFTTFGPETLGGSLDTPRGSGLVVLGDRAYFPETLYPGGTSAPNQTGYLRTYDLANPLQPEEIPPGWFINYPPRDIAGEMDADGRRTVAVATGPRTWFFLQGELVYYYDIQSSPSNLFVFDVTGDAPRWIGATNLTDNLMDGSPNRIVMKDGFVYAATNNKGIQVVDLEAAKEGFPEAGAPENDFVRNGAIFKGGYNKAAVVNTIPVMEPADAHPGDLNAYFLPLVDLKVADYNVGGETKRLVVATGPRKQIALVIVDPIFGETIWRGPIADATGSVEWGSAIATTTIDNRPIVLIGGLGVGTSSTGVLAVVDLSPLALNALAAPAVLKIIAIPHGVGDIVISGSTAILASSASAGSAGAGVATLVDLTKPGDPRIVGTLTGVGSRLALAGGLLYSTDRSFIKGLPTPLGGVRTSALSDVTLISGVNPEPILVSAGEEVFQNTDLTYRLVPPKVTDRAEVRIDVVGGGRVATIDAPGAENTGTVTWPKGTIVNTTQRYQASLYAEAEGHEIQAIPRRLKFDKVPLAITTRDRVVRIQFALAHQGLFKERRYGVKVFLAPQGSDFPAAPAFALRSDDIAGAYPNIDVWWDDLEPGSAKTQASWVTRKIDQMDLPPGTDVTIRRQAFEIGAVFAGYPRIKVVVMSEGDEPRELSVATGVVTPDGGWAPIIERVGQQIETGSSEASQAAMFGLHDDVAVGTGGPSAADDASMYEGQSSNTDTSWLSALKYRALYWIMVGRAVDAARIQGAIDGFLDTWNADKAFVVALGVAATDPKGTALGIYNFFKELVPAIADIARNGLAALWNAPGLLPLDQPFVLVVQGGYYSGYIVGFLAEQALVTVILTLGGAAVGTAAPIVGNAVGAAVGAAAAQVRKVQFVASLSIRALRVLRSIALFAEALGRAQVLKSVGRAAFLALYRSRAFIDELWTMYPNAAALVRRAAAIARTSAELAAEALKWLTIVDRMSEAAALRFVAFFEQKGARATAWMARWIESGRIPNGKRAVKDAFEATERAGEASESVHHLLVSTASRNVDGQANLARQLEEKYASQRERLDAIAARLAKDVGDTRYAEDVVGETGKFLADAKVPVFSEDGAEGLASVVRAECRPGQPCNPLVANKIRMTGTAEQLARAEEAMARLKRLDKLVSPEAWQRVAKEMIDVEDFNLAAGTARVTIHDFIELTLTGTDDEIAKVIKALDILRDQEGHLHIGIVIKPGQGDGSTRWIMNAKGSVPGARGYRFEVAGAQNLIQEGFVDPTRVTGMGLRILDANGNLLVEGDLVEQFFSGGLRYIDFKAAGGNYSLAGLERAKQALLRDEIVEMVYAFEEGTAAPADWKAAFDAANEVLADEGKRRMILKSAGAFK